MQTKETKKEQEQKKYLPKLRKSLGDRPLLLSEEWNKEIQREDTADELFRFFIFQSFRTF